MIGRLVIITGIGTEIGKTHVSEALLRALSGGRRVVGVKPVESGVGTTGDADAARLARVSTFHVKHRAYAFGPAVSPHLAARRAGVDIDVWGLAADLRGLRSLADLTLVELPGGLFSPLSATESNADLARALLADF